jgi:hypothetical protein
MVRNNCSWRITQALRDNAMDKGEEIINLFEIDEPPIDPFVVIQSEPSIYAEGADFGDAFDGRLEYLGNRYLLAYNTKYNRDEKNGLHPRIRFTIAHELGHYFLDEHRNILLKGEPGYSCNTEFITDTEMELQADYFATGFLMPSHILGPMVNKTPEPKLQTIQHVAQKFQVSMTRMMLRWVKLSDFPCGIFAIDRNQISWGWVSEPLLRIKACNRKIKVVSPDAISFLNNGSSNRYREGNGKGLLHYWVDIQNMNISVEEFYVNMPYVNYTLVFFYGYEDEIISVS